MNIQSLIFLSLALSFDSVAVSTIIGMSLHGSSDWHISRSLRFCICLGIMQGLMPIFGWLATCNFRAQIEGYDHWVAFGLLSILGIKMIYDSFKTCSLEQDNGKDQHFFELTSVSKSILFGIATSIDALIVGASMAMVDLYFLESSNQLTNIIIGGCVIALVTLICSIFGTIIGIIFGKGLGNKSNIVGGIILILIGVKILLEHLDII